MVLDSFKRFYSDSFNSSILVSNFLTSRAKSIETPEEKKGMQCSGKPKPEPARLLTVVEPAKKLIRAISKSP